MSPSELQGAVNVVSVPVSPPHVTTRSGMSERSILIESLIEANLDVARSVAARYRNRGIDLDDLEQVALLGLTKAAHRFDPDAGHEFLSFAVPTIRGELRRHFRDCGWTVRPPRRVQELQAGIGRAQDDLLAALGRSPRPSEIAAHLDVDVSDVVEALSVEGCFTPSSLDQPAGDGPSVMGDLLAVEDHALRSVEASVMLEPAVRQLSARDRRIVYLRFYEERSQQEIGEAVGLNQAQVSRVLARILKDVRAVLGVEVPVA